MPDAADYADLRDIAVEAVQAGGRAALPHFRQRGLQVEWKADDSPVTRADREAEASIRAVLQRRRPADAWLGEESGRSEHDAARCWIVDPIDGTRNFVRGIPLWATLVACVERDADGEERVVAAAAALPALGEHYEAYLGGGARCNGETVRVSAIDRLDESLWCYETPTWFRDHELAPVFDRLCEGTALQRGLCDAYGHMLVASGRAELVVEPQLAVWDVAATSLVVTEAGGRFTDLAGAPSICSGNAVLSNGLVHDQALAIIRGDTP